MTCLIAFLVTFLVVDGLGLAFALWHVRHAPEEKYPGQYG